jgi:hypothetical protein
MGDAVTCAVAGQKAPDGYYTLDRMPTPHWAATRCPDLSAVPCAATVSWPCGSIRS